MPTAFISYSWESDEHRDWVRGLATDLRARGVDVAEPAVLQPPPLDDVGRVCEQGVDRVQLGELGADPVLVVKLAAQTLA